MKRQSEARSGRERTPQGYRDYFRIADQPDGARKQPVMKRRVPRKLRRGAGGQAGQIWVMPPSTTSSMPVI